MKIKGTRIKNNLAIITLLLLIVIAPSCELFLPFPENEELKLDELSLSSPADGNTVNLDYSNKIQLTWADISENKNYQVEYEIYISENPNPGLYNSNLSYNYISIKLEENKTYYWKVVAKLDDKYVESEVWSFTTE